MPFAFLPLYTDEVGCFAVRALGLYSPFPGTTGVCGSHTGLEEARPPRLLRLAQDWLPACCAAVRLRVNAPARGGRLG